MLSQLSLAVFLIYALALPNGNLAHSQHSAHQATVTTPQGDILGSILTSRLGKTIYSFRGIRYAKAPVNELRFKPPVPIEKWESVFNATEDGPACPQPNEENTNEDCLLLNVYTNKLPKGNDAPKRPVIVYLHHGGFYRGSGSSKNAGPQYLLDKDIVLVTLNYRLGSLGFISTGEKDAPGNNGFKDQVLALKWVKSNIKAFGGDPNSVTIFGSGAGGVSVTLHMVSPLSQGLFHRAIAMSGSALGIIPVSHDLFELAKKQAKLLKCENTEKSEDILKCLQSKSAEDIANTLGGFKEFGDNPVYIWTPVAEKDHGQQRFLVEHPLETVKKGEFSKKVPAIFGITQDEYGHFAYKLTTNESTVQKMQDDFEEIMPISLMFERDTDNSNVICKNLKKFYFDNKNIENSSTGSLAEVFTDGIIGYPMHRTCLEITKNSGDKVYYYKFNYKGKFSNFYLPDSNGTVPYGVIHGDDLQYLFKKNDLQGNDLVTVEKMTTLFANFAKSGNPTPETNEKLDSTTWEPFTEKNQEFLEIGNKLKMEKAMFAKRYENLDKVFSTTSVIAAPNHSAKSNS